MLGQVYFRSTKARAVRPRDFLSASLAVNAWLKVL